MITFEGHGMVSEHPDLTPNPKSQALLYRLSTQEVKAVQEKMEDSCKLLMTHYKAFYSEPLLAVGDTQVSLKRYFVKKNQFPY